MLLSKLSGRPILVVLIALFVAAGYLVLHAKAAPKSQHVQAASAAGLPSKPVPFMSPASDPSLPAASEVFGHEQATHSESEEIKSF